MYYILHDSIKYYNTVTFWITNCTAVISICTMSPTAVKSKCLFVSNFKYNLEPSKYSEINLNKNFSVLKK